MPLAGTAALEPRSESGAAAPGACAYQGKLFQRRMQQLSAIGMRSNLTVMNGSPAPDHRTLKTALAIGVAVLANSFGNLLLALAMDHMPGFNAAALGSYVVRLIEDPYLVPGVTLTAIYTLTQVSLFSWADLSFVVPCISSSYVASTLLGEFVLGEHVHLLRWVGVILITVGVAMVAETPVATKPHPSQDGRC